MGIEFSLSRDAKELATYLAQLVREGVTYKIHQINEHVVVTLDGGY